MAKKFFNQKVNKTNNTVMQIIIISICIVGIIICFLVASQFNKQAPNAVIEVRESVSIEIGDDLPDKTLFFTKLENVKEKDIKISFNKADASKVGEYKVTIKLYREKYDAKLIVVDSKAPELTLKDLTISEGETYNANDFVENCKDNSGSCNIEFYKSAIDQNGNEIDYSQYEKAGTYTIQIVASDESNNTTLKETNLIIGTGNSTTKPVACKYGNGEYDKENYIVAVNVTNNGCALDLNQYQNETVLEPTQKLMENETDKLKKELGKLNVEGSISLNRNAVAIMNISGKGIVGYSIEMEISITKDSKAEVIEKYFLDANGTRHYSVNKYNLD